MSAPNDQPTSADDVDEAMAGTPDPGRGPTPDEARAAERAAAEVPDDVGEHYREMTELGAEVEGEGRID